MRQVIAAMVCAGWTVGFVSYAAAQQKPVGYVPTDAATVSGEMMVTGGKAALGGSSVVTALDRTAVVTLARGGSVDVCQTSSLHVTGTGGAADGLLLALDRGALELHMAASANDVLMTPDFRFAMESSGPLDLRVRVTRSGDTCVENKGRKAPALKISDTFGEASYEVKPGQHVMFEHGSLKEVVDRETTPCGCPPVEPGLSIADAALSGKAVTPKVAEKQHPFPTAVSEGLAEPVPLPAQKPGETHMQVSDSLAYDGSVPVAATAVERGAGVAAGDPVVPQAQEEKKGGFHALGRFFKRIFGGG